MLAPVMRKHFISIILFLLCLLVSRPVEARLTLGVVIGPDEAVGEVTSVQAVSLASLLAERLHEEVVVKELADSATLVNWLDRFAMVDLALLSTKEVKANPGRFLQIEPFDKRGKFTLVARQGVAGDLPQRINSLVREPGFAFRDAVETLAPQARQSLEESPLPLESGPTSIDEEIVSKIELQHVPPLSPGRAWAPQEESAFRDILPSDESPTKKMVLGVFPDPRGLMRTSLQAEQLATYLQQVLPVSVTVREFTSIEAFTEWFMRYRMVDLAVLSPDIAETKLGRDYLPVAKLLRTDKPGLESAALVVMRRGQNEEIQARLQGALLNMAQTENGQSLMTAFKISEVLPPAGLFVPPPVVDQEPEPVIVAEKPPFESVEEPVAELVPSIVKYTDPVEPVAPPEVADKELPELPEVAQPVAMLPVSEVPDVIQLLPEFSTIPAEPFLPATIEAIKVPDVMTQQLEPPLLEVPPLPAIDAPIPPAELTAIVEPELPVPVAELVDVAPRPTLEEPTIVVVPPLPAIDAPIPPAELTAIVEPDLPVPVAELVDVAPRPTLEEPTIVVVPPMPQGEVVSPAEPEIESELVVSKEVAEEKEQEIVKEVSTFADVIPAYESTEAVSLIIDQATEVWSDEEFAAMLAEDKVAAVVAQPNIPQELRPSGVPVVRPGRITRRTTAVEDELLLASLPEPLKRVEPSRLPNLLPEPEPEPGIVYVVPFVAVMVPDEVNARVFDQFIDTLIRDGETLGLQFVILKEGLQWVSPEWLAIRKYVTGEIYAYVEDSGCCSTDLRSKARLIYHRPNQLEPAFGFEYPVKSFFDHDRSSIGVERAKLADDIATTLADELLKALQN